MLVIHRGRGGGGMGRNPECSGSGLISSIASKLLSGGVSAISRGASSAIAHKVGDAVVKGAATTGTRVADAVIQEAGARAARAVDSLVRKRPAPPSPIIVKRRKIIDGVIDGSGIVYD